MLFKRLLITTFSLACSLTAAAAEPPSDEREVRVQKGIDAAFPGKRFVIWVSVSGDMNDDGLSDVAAIVITDPMSDAPREEKLVVLAGKENGEFTPLSLSGEFCHAQKFYNLSSAAGKAFEVEVVEAIDATHANSFTLKFRYNPKLGDFELLGREDRSQEYDQNASYNVSVNYATGLVVTTRHLGKSYIERRTTADGIEKLLTHSRHAARHKAVTGRFESSERFRLQGFDCSNYQSSDPANKASPWIDENFKVQRQ